MARYCVHLDDLEVTVECDGDETDAIRAARESTGVTNTSHQRVHRLPEPEAGPSGESSDPPVKRRRRKVQ